MHLGEHSRLFINFLKKNLFLIMRDAFLHWLNLPKYYFLDRIMASEKKLLEAIERNGLAIAAVHTAIANTTPTILKALEDAKNGAATSQQLEEAIRLLDINTEGIGKAKDAVLQMVPSIPSPATPTTSTEPAPSPIAIADNGVEEISITSTPDSVGLPGSVAIDF